MTLISIEEVLNQIDRFKLECKRDDLTLNQLKDWLEEKLYWEEKIQEFEKGEYR